MPVPGVIYRVLIASPGDVDGERKTIRDALLSWNSSNTRYTSVAIEPVMWETHSRPDATGRAQASLNSQLVNWCDFGIACFWSTSGTPTGDFQGGTIEEIDELQKAGKPVMIYFCKRAIPQHAASDDGYRRLIEFKSSIKDRALYREYETVDELANLVQSHVSKLMQELLQQPRSVATMAQRPTRKTRRRSELATKISYAISRLEGENGRLRVAIETGRKLTSRSADPVISSLAEIESVLRHNVAALPRRGENLASVAKDLKTLIVTLAHESDETRKYHRGQIAGEDHWKRIEAILYQCERLQHHLRLSLKEELQNPTSDDK